MLRPRAGDKSEESVKLKVREVGGGVTSDTYNDDEHSQAPEFPRLT